MFSRRSLKPCLMIAGAVLFLFLLTCFSIGWFFSNLMLQPNFAKERRASWAKTDSNVRFNDFIEGERGERFKVRSTYGYDLACCFVPARMTTRNTAVIVHGYIHRKELMLKYALLLHDLGLNVVLYDHRNCGESGGDTTTMGYFEQHDLAQVIEKTRQRSGRGTKIVVFGASMGASTALMLAGSGQNDGEFTIADAGYSDFIQEALYRIACDYPKLPSWLRPGTMALGSLFVRLRSGAVIKDIAPIDTVASIKHPLLFITTEEDGYIPPQMTKDLYAAARAKKTLRVFEKGGHTQAIDAYPSEYRDLLAGFLLENKLIEPGLPKSLME